MFPIHYLNSQGGIVARETSEATRLADAVAGARQRAATMYQDATSFVVFDATGEQVVHREPLG